MEKIQLLIAPGTTLSFEGLDLVPIRQYLLQFPPVSVEYRSVPVRIRRYATMVEFLHRGVVSIWRTPEGDPTHRPPLRPPLQTHTTASPKSEQISIQPTQHLQTNAFTLTTSTRQHHPSRLSFECKYTFTFHRNHREIISQHIDTYFETRQGCVVEAYIDNEEDQVCVCVCMCIIPSNVYKLHIYNIHILLRNLTNSICSTVPL